MTEDEAKTKWCPVIEPAIHCIGSGCMAWRWNPVMFMPYQETDPAMDHLGSGGQEPNTAKGYCGLAGKP